MDFLCAPRDGERLKNNALLWPLFFLICLGLGYPTLNRYDPRLTPGISHAAAHADTVAGEHSPVMQNRILVSYLAKPFYRLGRGRLKTWDPVLFGLLVSNAVFAATTAWLLVLVGQKAAADFSTALLGGLLYLLNFDVANYQLAGNVDSAECCFLMAVTATLCSKRWSWLPLWGLLGGLSKETFLPTAVPLALAWWITVSRREGFKRSQGLAVAAMTFVCLATTAAAIRLSCGQSLAAFLSAQEDPAGAGRFFLPGIFGNFFNHTFAYIFAWLLPLGLIRIGELPRPWVSGAGAAALAVLAMGAYHDAGSSTARVLFHAAGPILSLSTALLLTGQRQKR